MKSPTRCLAANKPLIVWLCNKLLSFCMYKVAMLTKSSNEIMQRRCTWEKEEILKSDAMHPTFPNASATFIQVEKSTRQTTLGRNRAEENKLVEKLTKAPRRW